MGRNIRGLTHSAEDAALGFYYQTYYALLLLLERRTDDATVSVETLDDIVLRTDGQSFLVQLKHSLSASPAAISIKSSSVWRTLKAWIDAQPFVDLSETYFFLVTVAPLTPGSELECLLESDENRDALAAALTKEAQRVIDERTKAGESGKNLPHQDRVQGCEAFLALTDVQKIKFLSRISIKSSNSNITEIPKLISDRLDLLPVNQRDAVATRLIEWWDREIVYSLCGERERLITRTEIQQKYMALISEIAEERLVPEYENVGPPDDYQPDGMLSQQISLVKGTRSDFKKAIREEWRARSQRSSWMDNRLSMASAIDLYDKVLIEFWSDKHDCNVEKCEDDGDENACAIGLELLRWTHNEAPHHVRPFAEGWSAAYYVRGSYQVLAINTRVGWHPNYDVLLGIKK